MDSWCKFRCPACNATCWFSNGDTSDITAPDVERVRCHACKAILALPECEGDEPAVVEDDPDVYWDDTHPQPR